jgi:UDP-2,3-diacylglucosamine pyrophosphatase LpxH
MRVRQGRNRRVRSLFVSDVHLGCRHAHVQEFLRFVRRQNPESLYIVGDFVDWWKLRKSHAWQQAFNDILARLYELSEQGTRIFYTPGNHDAFLRQYSWNFSFVKVADEFVVKLSDGRKFLVTHGDRFDRVECAAAWVSMLASVAYDGLLSLNRLVSWYRRTPRSGACAFSSAVKRTVKQAVRYISDFERRLAEHARRRDCSGVICGHIHTPAFAEIHGVQYCNTGDWVENCTAFVEYDDGVLELIHYLDEDGSAEPSDAAICPEALASPDAELPPIDEWVQAEAGMQPAAVR